MAEGDWAAWAKVAEGGWVAWARVAREVWGLEDVGEAAACSKQLAAAIWGWEQALPGGQQVPTAGDTRNARPSLAHPLCTHRGDGGDGGGGGGGGRGSQLHRGDKQVRGWAAKEQHAVLDFSASAGDECAGVAFPCLKRASSRLYWLGHGSPMPSASAAAVTLHERMPVHMSLTTLNRAGG